MISCVKEHYNNYKVQQYLENFAELARIPNVSNKVLLGDVESSINNAPHASINIFSMDPDIDIEFIHKCVEQTGSSCLFALD